jgi:hypothetical protein
MSKVEMTVEVEHFFFKVFNYFYIAICSYIKLENMLEVLLMFILENFLDRFIFTWGCEQCSKMFGEISPESHSYLNDLK